MLGVDLSGSVADIDGERTGDRFEALLCCLLAAVARSWTYLPVSDLLDLAQLLPDGLARRVRAWILAQAPQTAPELLLEETCHAMSTRDPSGDDLAVLDRVLNDPDATIYIQRWRAALGDAPTVTELGAALRSPPLPRPLMCRLLWASLLPEEVQGHWAGAVQIFTSRYGSARQYLQRRHGVEVSDVESPIGEAELLAVEPEAAARLVAALEPSAWRVAQPKAPRCPDPAIGSRAEPRKVVDGTVGHRHDPPSSALHRFVPARRRSTRAKARAAHPKPSPRR